MLYIEAPKFDYYRHFQLPVFLAGGITNCPDWQSIMVQRLSDIDVLIYNPRRKNFSIDDPSATELQIFWEHTYLKKAKCILFWFPFESLCPIVLFELGFWLNSDKKIFVGTHADYKRRVDVEVQTMLARPDVEIVYNVYELADQVREYFWDYDSEVGRKARK